MKTRGTPERATRSSQRKRAAALPLSGKKKKNKTPSAVKATKILKKAPPKKPPEEAAVAPPKKAQPKPKKPTKEQVDDAKKKTAEREAEKGAPEEVAVAVKPEPGTKKGKNKGKKKGKKKKGKRRLWTDEEDLALSRAYVNVTVDPTVGAQQKGEDFWKKVHEKMYELYNGSAEVVDQEQWEWKSAMNRMKKIIGPDTTKFNSCYLMIEKASGWTEQMHLDAAAELFEQTEERAWKFTTCARILHGCPKYKPKNDPKPEEGEEEEDGKPKATTGKANPVASIQGKGLALPVGTKKAKKQAFAAKLDMESVACTAQTDAILQVAKA